MQLSKNHRDTRHSCLIVKLNKCGNSTNNHLGCEKTIL